MLTPEGVPLFARDMPRWRELGDVPAPRTAAEEAMDADAVRWELHRIASGAGPHTDPDDTACLLGTYTTREAAERAGREELRANPEQWLQVQDSDQRTPGADVH